MKLRPTRKELDLVREEGLKLADVADRWRRQRDMMYENGEMRICPTDPENGCGPGAWREP